MRTTKVMYGFFAHSALWFRPMTKKYYQKTVMMNNAKMTVLVIVIPYTPAGAT